MDKRYAKMFSAPIWDITGINKHNGHRYYSVKAATESAAKMLATKNGWSIDTIRRREPVAVGYRNR